MLTFFGYVLVVLFWTSLTMFSRETSPAHLCFAVVSIRLRCVVSDPVRCRGFVAATGLVSGAAWATTNWWYAHNVLGLYITPMGLAAAYYLIPKVTGQPIHSYHLSLLGFWANALFYSWIGTHHLVGGPLPAWIITVGIVGSIMMFVPVITVAINHHMTMVGRFHLLRTVRRCDSVFGAMCYTAVSFQGSIEALRSVSQVAHFTHYTVAHAHLGMYAFYTMIMFGAMYYVIPRLTRNEWSSPRLIKVHFWTCALGIGLYFVALSWAGWYQGS